MKKPPSLVRRFLLWWMSAPANPYICASVTVDWSDARTYLLRLAPRDGVKVTVQHLVAGAIARTLAEHPEANARIFGRRIVPQSHVGIFMPVELAERVGASRELSAMVLQEAERRSLRDIAAATTHLVSEERAGRIQNPFVRSLVTVLERLPDEPMWRSLDAMDRALRRPAVAERLFASLPVTTGLSNIGSHIGTIDGALFRGGAIALPPRLGQLGTFWGLSGIQDEVLAVNGEAVVRPVLPVLFVFDHRLVDGVKAGRIMATFARCLRDPESVFGVDGDSIALIDAPTESPGGLTSG